MIRFALALLAMVMTASVQAAGPSPAPEGARVYFITPADGAVIEGPVTVRFGLSGMGVAPAGVERQHTGHHHLLINLDTLPPLDQSLPANEHVVHFGAGQTETTLNLAPGKHRLQLLLGDHLHIPHNPPVLSDAITITVR